MKVLFKNITKYDKENKENFIKFHKEKYGKKELIRTIAICICITYMLMFNIRYMNWYFLLILMLFGVLIYFINKQVVQKREEKNKKQKNKEFEFFFYDKHIKIKCKREFERMNYFEIKKIFETKENFFLYVDEKHSLILDKEGFCVGTSDEFSEFIKRKCPFRYSNNKSK